MNTQELTTMIHRLKSNIINEDAYFGFYEYGGGPDESCVKANKEGLIRFATELLEGSLAASKKEFINGEKEFFSLSNDWFSEDSEFYFSYVEIFQQRKSDIKPNTRYKETWKDLLAKYIFITILIFILISILVGAYTILSWLF